MESKINNFLLVGHAYLLVANRYYIRNLTLQTYPPSNRSKQTLVDQSMTNAVGLDYDWSNQMLYWTDVTDDKHEISRMSFNGSNKEVRPTYLLLISISDRLEKQNCKSLCEFKIHKVLHTCSIE